MDGERSPELSEAGSVQGRLATADMQKAPTLCWSMCARLHMHRSDTTEFILMK